MSTEFYKKHRPSKLAEVVGQNTAIATLRKAMKDGKVPQALLFTGPTGTGKTTLARIVRQFLGCAKVDYEEINTADFKGIDTVREIRGRINLRPLAGPVRVYLIDECHKLTNDAQNAMLKLLEDTPSHVYFLLGTSEPHKLIAAIHGRCTEIKLTALKDDQLQQVITDVLKKEELTVGQDVIDKIIVSANGSARKALVLLEAVSRLETEKEQTEAIAHSMVDKDLALKLALALVYPRGGHWTDICKILRALEDDEAEAIRYLVLGMARSALIGSKDGKPVRMQNCPRAAFVISKFEHHFYDSKHYGLAKACWDVFNQN